MRRKLGIGLLLAAVIVIGVGLYLHQREAAFKKQLSEASDNIVEMMDALEADQKAFDMAHDRALNSTHTLGRMAYNGGLRRGSLRLIEEVGRIAACREIKDQFDRYQTCLNETGRIDHDAWADLPEVR